MQVPDKGPQSLETTKFSKLIILLWSMPQSTSALTGSSIPTSLLHIQPDLPRFPWSMPTNARALQTCNGNSTFFQNTNRGRGGTTLSHNSSVLGAHTQAELVSLSRLPARTQPNTAEGAPAGALPLLPPALQLHAKKMFLALVSSVKFCLNTWLHYFQCVNI